MEWEIAQKLGLATGLGLLVGIQREWTKPHVAGVRTFTLLTVLGTVVGIFSENAGNWLIVATLLAVALMLVVGNFVKYVDEEDTDPGLTTQTAALVMYLVGVGIALDYRLLSIMVGGGTAVLLHWKERLHRFVQRLGKADLKAIIQLVLIALVILPILPNESYDPYEVLNPFEIWMMVCLIVGISLGGYIASKFLGARTGALVGGVLGGLISSTATSVSYARRTRQSPSQASLAAVVIMMASTIVFGRVLVEIAIVTPEIWMQIVWPLIAMMGWMLLITVTFFFTRGKQQADVAPQDEDPSEIRAAIVFGVLYAAVLFAVAAVKENFGTEALYAVATLSGLTDMDAITLSTAQMVKKDNLEVGVGWRMILVGAMSNLLFKGLAVGFLGARGLLWRIALLFTLSLAGGIVILILWPA